MTNKTFAQKHASTKLFKFETPDTFEFKDLKQLVIANGIDTIYQVNAIYINTKGDYGDAPNIITNNEIVNAPAHLTTAVREILQDGESVSMINNGLVGFVIYTYENKHGINYSINWIDVAPQ